MSGTRSAALAGWRHETDDRHQPETAREPHARESQQLVLPAPGLGTEALSRAPRPRVMPSRVAGQVYAFHRAFGLPRATSPSLDSVTDEILRLRERLLDEETAEFAMASHRRDLVGMADALADVVYVAYGTAITLGLDLDLILDEVHRSNMSKLDERGRPVLRHDGKVLKSPRYRPPNIASVISDQPMLPFGPTSLDGFN